MSRQELCESISQNASRINKIQGINSNQKNHPSLNFLLPADYGGLNDPENQEYINRLRLFTEENDLP